MHTPLKRHFLIRLFSLLILLFSMTAHAQEHEPDYRILFTSNQDSNQWCELKWS